MPNKGKSPARSDDALKALDKRLQKVLSKQGEEKNRVDRLWHTAHLQELTVPAFQWISATTDPFGWDEDGGPPVRVPDASGARTAAATVHATLSVAVPATMTIAIVELTPNSDDNNLLKVHFSPSAATGFSGTQSVAPARWAAVKADMAGARSCRIAAGGLRVNMAGGADYQSGFFNAAEGNVTPHDTVNYRTPAETMAGFTRYGSAFSSEVGCTTRKLYEDEFHVLDPVSSATTLTYDRLYILATGLTPGAILNLEAILYVEYRTIQASVVEPTPSPADLHYDMLRILALSESDLDAEGHTFRSVLHRLKDYAVAGAKGALKSGVPAGPGEAVAGVINGAFPLLMDDLLRILPANWSR